MACNVLLIDIGVIIEATPVIPSKLNKFDPNIAPRMKLICPLKAATTEVTTSGIDVPIATKVKPIIVWLTFKVCATITAPFTKISAPTKTPTIPIKENNRDLCKEKKTLPSSLSNLFLLVLAS